MVTRRNGARAQTTASRPLAVSSMIFKLSDSHSQGQAKKPPPPQLQLPCGFPFINCTKIFPEGGPQAQHCSGNGATNKR